MRTRNIIIKFAIVQLEKTRLGWVQGRKPRMVVIPKHHIQSDSNCTEDGINPTTYDPRCLAVCVNSELQTTDDEFEFGKDGILGCISKMSGIKVYWEDFNGNRTKDLAPPQPTRFEEPPNGSLIIRSPVRNVAGVYYCCYDDASGKVRQPATYYAEPKLIMAEKSSSVQQGDDFTLDCLVLGYPKPKVVWYREKVEIKPGGRFKIEGTMVKGLPAQRLTITSIDFDDVGDYICQATSTKYPDIKHEKQKLRVTDKYAFVWPMVAVIMEFLLVAAIIWIHEHKQIKEQRELEAEEGKQFQRRESRNHRRT